MCAPLLVMGAMAVAGGAQAYSQVKQGQAQKKYYDAMADTARAQGDAQRAVDEKKSQIEQDIGAQQVKAAAIKGAEAKGLQDATLAQNNVAGTGTAQDIAIDTMRKVKQDEINLKYNADTKSWAFDTEGLYAKWQGDTQGAQYNMAGKQALSAAKLAATVTMISTAASVASMGLGGVASATTTAGGMSSASMGANLFKPVGTPLM